MTSMTTPAAVPLVPVNLDNFIRVETHHYMKQAVEKGCFGKLLHARGPTPVDQQIISASTSTHHIAKVYST